VLSIQPRSVGGANEELRSVGVGSSCKRKSHNGVSRIATSGATRIDRHNHVNSTSRTVRHAQDSLSGMWKVKVLVVELVAVDRLPTSTIVVGKVTSLTHEL